MPQPGENSSPALMVRTGTRPYPPLKACPVVSVKVKSPSTTSMTLRSASRPTAMAPIWPDRPSALAALTVVALTTSDRV
ncbi:MAG TPA: hypothetical protein VGG83_23215 [Trebonia sp.]